METNRGRITTFYSYKGGTGRSMALANIACCLSRRDDLKRGVLAIDWDLEAPGLHWFFRRGSSEPEGLGPGSMEQDGLIELFEQFDSLAQPPSGAIVPEAEVDKIIREIRIEERFVTKTRVPRLDFMQAGRLDVSYGERVTAFNWRELFDRAPSLIRSLAEFLGTKYDYVLIDSRTGLNDISGICTALLPDQLVLVFTPNRQSLIDGIGAVAQATQYRLQSEDIRPLAVFPLPSRIDVTEPELLERWRFGDSSGEEDRQGYQRRFEKLFSEVYQLPVCNLQNYFDEVQIQHVPRYSYGEEIAALRERRTRLSISRSYETVAGILASNQAPWSAKSASQEVQLGPASSGDIKVQSAKEYMAEGRFDIKLRDLTVREVREVLKRTPGSDFEVQVNQSTFAERIRTYEEIMSDLLRIEAVLGYWGEERHRNLLPLGAKRISNEIEPQNGLPVWLNARWYPAQLLLYAGGIAAVAGDRYENLRDLMLGTVSPYPYAGTGGMTTALIISVAKAMLELDRASAFEMLPGLAGRRSSRSDHLYAHLKPVLDEALFLGSEYDSAFDRFEVLYALEHCHQTDHGPNSPHRFWGPVGRSFWKAGAGVSPLDEVIAEGVSQGESWRPLQAGFFGGSFDRFKEVALDFREAIMRSRWEAP